MAQSMTGTRLQMRHMAVPALRPLARTSVNVRPADDVAIADYEALCRESIHAPAQHPLWIRSWIMATGADVIIVTVERFGVPACALALEVVQEGPFRVARFVGGSHANGNFGAISRRSPTPLSTEEGVALGDAIRSARPDIDLVHLQRQNPSFQGVQNPLTALATACSPNVALAIDLSDGFEATLSRRNGKRKRKKYRHQVNKFSDAGGYRLIIANSPEETDRLLSAFFEMKAARLLEMGIANVFEPVDVKAFFRLLFQSAIGENEPPFFLHGLEVGGRLAAVNGCSITAESIVCDFGGIIDDNSNASPGYFLDYHAIEYAAELGKPIFDFGVGDEPYKRSWCDIETWQFDTLIPLTAQGHVARLLEMSRAQAVRFIKSNHSLWSLVKQLRAKVAGSGKNPAPQD